MSETPTKRLRSLIAPALVLLVAALPTIPAAMVAASGPPDATPPDPSGMELSAAQCDEADGHYAGSMCRNYDQGKASRVVAEDERQQRSREEAIAEGDRELPPDELSYEECQNAGGFSAGNICRNYDEHAARQQVEQRR